VGIHVVTRCAKECEATVVYIITVVMLPQKSQQ
jgi:hypothetical protein